MKCLNCNNETPNPKFCSRSCSVSYNNKKSPKRKPEHSCPKCGQPITANKRYCQICRPNNKDMTLAEAIYKKHHPSSAYALARTRARAIAKKNNRTTCEKCGYNRHVEVCHKKPISSFSLSTKLSEINDNDNLIVLCRNCHWEFDHQATPLGIEPN